MSEPIKELIAQNVLTTLQGVTADNGYGITLTVARNTRKAKGAFDHGQTYVVQKDEKRDTAADSYPMLGWIQPFAVLVHIVYPEDSDESEDAILNRIDADVKKALTEDPQRGNHPDTGQKLALDTKLQASQYRDQIDGNQIVATDLIVNFDVHYTTLETDITSLG